MNLTKLFTGKDLSEQKNQIRDRLKSVNNKWFPKGIFGQIEIEQKGKRLVVSLPFESATVSTFLAEYVNDIYPHVEYVYKPTVGNHSNVSGVKSIVAVASGKGGVGKSTVTTNLAVTLAKLGHKVGVLDADIYGPSMPMMFGLEGESVTTKDEKTMEPHVKFDVALNSIGFLIPKDKAAIWRGPMASRALMQVVNETNWPELDILLVDMPPGTGDIQLTMSENVKCDGALIVTTPQNVALADAEKGIEMFQKVATPVLGVVENMSQFVCDNCGHIHHLFGTGGGEKCASNHNVPLLAELPLNPLVRSSGDSGVPFVMSENEDKEYQQLAFSLMMQLSKQTQQIITLA
ncbi:Mrp/NBP35 family ATP-binding protein [Psychrosphaera sp. B3R10]|uniref:Mrp/NBP35 family ATP-binding protein n=1 Tax=unclassified Psychrosphaera TaxID=2641570 RepID=UPI001C092CE7|nr:MULTISPECIES: Mrp/NBP35 family ATP-binding protein [unclassified Psychrosphaera]MBU2881630.1 Mrp/NBP35 family ATP-binding protein [Psychrosphaera sp. I2R16]MBU2991115.1 Mrp/NBP35 family ATP-binding protein [Psychrosphaera sp. B3R10]MDO6721468.1 Mrp/NBP35 family ATP-binding protein [Psychrosphaera sp. 1_MG-2023]